MNYFYVRVKTIRINDDSLNPEIRVSLFDDKKNPKGSFVCYVSELMKAALHRGNFINSYDFMREIDCPPLTDQVKFTILIYAEDVCERYELAEPGKLHNGNFKRLWFNGEMFVNQSSVKIFIE